MRTALAKSREVGPGYLVENVLGFFDPTDVTCLWHEIAYRPVELSPRRTSPTEADQDEESQDVALVPLQPLALVLTPQVDVADTP